MRILRRLTVIVLSVVVLASAMPAVGAEPVAHRARAHLFGLLEVTAGRLLLSVRRTARVTVFANGHRLERLRAQAGRVYEVPIHRRGRVRVVAVAGQRRQTVSFRVA